MLRGSSALSEFRTSLSKVLTLWHCVKVKQRYLYVIWINSKYVPIAFKNENVKATARFYEISCDN